MERRMKVSRSKTKFTCKKVRGLSGPVRPQGAEIKKVEEFLKYLESIVPSNGKCGAEEVKKHVQGSWNGWRKLSGVMCDKKKYE